MAEEEKKKRHWKRKILFLGVIVGAVRAVLNKKKASSGDEAGWEEAKPSS